MLNQTFEPVELAPYSTRSLNERDTSMSFLALYRSVLVRKASGLDSLQLDTTLGKSHPADGRQNAFFGQQFYCHGLWLAATGLSLTHPYSGEQLSVTAMPDVSFMDIMERFHWQLGGTVV